MPPESETLSPVWSNLMQCRVISGSLTIFRSHPQENMTGKQLQSSASENADKHKLQSRYETPPHPSASGINSEAEAGILFINHLCGGAASEIHQIRSLRKFRPSFPRSLCRLRGLCMRYGMKNQYIERKCREKPLFREIRKGNLSTPCCQLNQMVKNKGVMK